MSLTSFSFFLFLFVIFVLYYCFGGLQKYVLLVASVFFYFQLSSSGILKTAGMILGIIILTYVGGRLIQRTDGLSRKLILLLSISGLAGILVITKYAYNVMELVGTILRHPMRFSVLKFGSIAGISYFILSAISYLADVYMEIVPADKNVGTVSLFVLFFPQVISGPVTRFEPMSSQFRGRHHLNYDTITHGARRMIWGYFKKLVISERFAIVSNAVFEDYNSYSGIVILFATICYGVQIYTDFSGCMDIVLGASEIFDIHLPENFRAPYMSTSYQEFYQRWHMTLGGWFKDYVMYPVQKSKPIQTIGKLGKNWFGKKKGKMVSFYLAMLILWFGIGLWHGGTALYFMVSTVIPFTILVISDLARPFFMDINRKLHINTEAESWRWFQRCRTYLVVCLIFFFLCAGGVHRGFDIAHWSFFHPIGFVKIDEIYGKIGLSVADVIIMTIGGIVLLSTDILIDKGTNIFELLDKQNLAIRELIIMMELAVIAFYGMVGQSQFLYFKF